MAIKKSTHRFWQFAAILAGLYLIAVPEDAGARLIGAGTLVVDGWFLAKGSD